MRIALFVTCLSDTFVPRAGAAVVKVLEHLGHEVVFPEEQTCCGQPMYNNGFQEAARRLACRQMRVFSGAETVITPSGSCAAMIRRHYPELFETGSREWRAARELACKTFEFVEFLVKVEHADLRQLGVRWGGIATYHYSCHLRELGMTDEVVRLLHQIQDLEYRPLEKMEQCCGFGGLFAVKYPAISGEMVRDKVRCIRRTSADTVICNDAGCTLNIAGACHREGLGVRFRSLAEILAEGLGLLEREVAS
ncbi:MAG: (Fe-S)-binding protein [Planctomycetota bacterium]